jgi:peptidoglycan/LPS O-acetylase OafA/YrhL
MHSIFRRTMTGSGGNRLRAPTAYLDGLRGLLAIFIFNAHLTPIIILGYDMASGQQQFHTDLVPPRNVLDIPLVAYCVKHWELFTVPIVKLIYSGSPAVSLFFAISGYVMSLKWIDHLEHRPAKPLQPLPTVSLSTFRRPLYLILPAVASMLGPFILCKIGLLPGSDILKRHGLTKLEKGLSFGLNQFDLFPNQQTTWQSQSHDLLLDYKRLFAIFTQRFDFPPRYNPVLWTVKVDLRASIVLLATQIALLETRKLWRLCFLVILTVTSWSLGSLECPLFWAGWVIAELHYSAEQQERSPKTPLGDIPATSKAEAKRVNLSGGSRFSLRETSIFILGCYLASYPTWSPSRAPAYSILRTLVPGSVAPPRTWHSIGAALILYSLRSVPWARKVCETRGAQFLGQYSFSFYLVHVWLIACFGPPLFSWIWVTIGHSHPLPFTVAFGTAYTMLLSCVLATSIIFRAAVEIPLKKLVDNLYRLASSSP